jgi:hypothetical protein
LTATLGTALAESSVEANAFAKVVYHAKTIGEIVVQEAIVSATIAFVLGAVVQRIRRNNMARWMALLGIVTFAATLRFQPVSVLDQSRPFDLGPVFEPTDWNKVTLWWVSVRFIGYSLGALCCTMLVATKAVHTQSLAVAEKASE